MQQTVESIVQAMNQGRHVDALAMSRSLAQAFPNEEGVLSLLAVCEQNAGDMYTARDILLGLTTNHPQTWQHWNNLGNVQRLLGDLASAESAYSKALALNNQSPRLHANLGLLELNVGEFAKAREHLCQACLLEGAEDGMRVWAAVACHAMADDEAAAALLQGWKSWKGLSEEANLELGWLLFELGDWRSGDSLLATEFRDSNLRTRALARRILARERLNRLDEAFDLAGRMPPPIQIADRQARMEALQSLAAVATRRRDHATARELYTAALQLEQPAQYKRPLYFSLARTCDALDDVEGAVRALTQAHADAAEASVVEEGRRLAGTGLLALANERFKPISTADWPAPGEASTGRASPIFVVGFPRSGTTLLEQMLAAHPGVVSTDEKPMVQRMLEWLREHSVDYPQGLGALRDAEVDALRKCYWTEADTWVEGGVGENLQLVDKHPLNFLALPLIDRVFPDACVIMCRRHPCDSLLSSLMQNFRDPRLASECRSMQSLAALYLRLADQWRTVSTAFRGRLLVCRHEDLVADTEQTLGRIAEFTGLGDTAAMLNYREHARARGFIGTPSYAQVIAGINPEAAGRWTRYADYLAPILPTLAPLIEEWGYEC